MTAPDPIVELAFGADLNDPPSQWQWTDVSDRLVPQNITIKRGRANEASRTQPTTVGFTLDNADGALTPDNATSPFYPDVVRGTPCRVSVDIDDVDDGLRLTGEGVNGDGGYVSTPDDPALRATGDISIRFDARSVDWSRPQAVCGRGATGTDASWWVMVGFQGDMYLNWTTDGDSSNRLAAGTSINVPAGRYRQAWRIDLDVDDGAGGHSVTFYTAPSLAGPWTQFGDPVVGTNPSIPVVGTTSVWAGTSPLEVGAVFNGGHFFGAPWTTFAGEFYGFEFYDGTTLVAAADFTSQPIDATTFTDAATGLEWTLHRDARFTSPRTRFVGQVDEIVPSWPEGDNGESVVNITASGMLRRLAQGAKPLDSAVFRAVMSDQYASNVIAYWPLEDGSDSIQAASPIPGVRPMTIAGARFAANDSLPASKPLVNFAGGQPGGFSAVVPPPSPANATDWMVTFFSELPTPVASPAETLLMQVTTTGTIATWRLSINNTAIFLRGYNNNGNEIFEHGLGVLPTDFEWGQTTIRVVQEGGSIHYYVASLSLGGSVSGFDGVRASSVVGRVTGVATLFANPGADGITYGHVAVTTGLEPGWLGWQSGANDAYIGEPAGERFRRLCVEMGVPFRIVGDPADTVRMGPQRVQTLLDLLNECAEADMGVIHEDRDRIGLVYRTRASLYAQSAALALDASTREVDDRVVSDLVNPFVPTLDDQRLRNDVTVTRTEGSSVRVTTDPPPAPGDLYEEAVTVNVDSDLRLPDQAGWRLHLGTWPGMRYPSVSTELSDAPHLIHAWLNTDIGDRITVDNLPAQHPARTVEVLVEGYDETITPHRWTPAIACSPAGPWNIGVRDSGGYGDPAWRDTINSVLDANLGETDTEVFWSADDGWTDDPGDVPFDIDVAGERMTVLAVTHTTPGDPRSGSFDVIRSVNGVVKSHPIGTRFRLWRPSYRAL